ncbi:MAG: FHA domain-containing protein [Chloroflexi bacterium]|nr:FHA domain-containing protein [Chloroflexota bacterium]
MNRLKRAYYYAVLGAMGGLFGWQVTETLELAGGQNVYLSNVFVGGAIGLCVGLFIGFAEGLLTRSLLRIVRAGFVGGLIGLIAGAVGLPLGEYVFQLSGGEILGRALGWATFGLLVGLAEGITGGTQMYKGALGGLIGGAVGGVILELARIALDDPLLGKSVGLVLLGGSVGAFIALIVVLLSRAWLEVKSGKLQGTEFILDKFLPLKGPAAIIGSSVLKADIALTDPDVAPQHAQLKGADTHFTLQDMSMGQGTFVNGKRIEVQRLANRQVIRVGDTELVYHEKR